MLMEGIYWRGGGEPIGTQLRGPHHLREEMSSDLSRGVWTAEEHPWSSRNLAPPSPESMCTWLSLLDRSAMLLCHFWTIATKTLEPSARGHSPLPFIHLINIATGLQGHPCSQRQPSHPAPLPASVPAQPFTVVCGIRWEFCFDSRTGIQFHKQSMSVNSTSPQTNLKGV